MSFSFKRFCNFLISKEFEFEIDSEVGPFEVGPPEVGFTSEVVPTVTGAEHEAVL